jgi:lipoate-protein ligase A
MTREEIVESFISSFSSQYGLLESHVTTEEEQAARVLVESKFATQQWLELVP